MPANLTPKYHRAESAYRQAETAQEELECLQWMLREIPKHKGTDKLQADLKSKIAKAKDEALKQATAKSLGKSAAKIPKQGAGRILLIGPPNSGKSSLLAALTRAQPDIAPYPFTTQTPLPGMMSFEDCPFQLIDLPPITCDAVPPTTLGLVRGADLIFCVIDLASDEILEDTQLVFRHFSNGKTRFGRTTMLDSTDIGTSYTETLLLLHKSDVDGASERLELLEEFIDLPFDRVLTSTLTGEGLEELGQQAFSRMGLVRVYTKHPQEKTPDLSNPFVIRRGGTIVEVAELVHHDLASRLKSARIWGSAIHDGTTVKPDYEPRDGDIVELHTN